MQTNRELMLGPRGVSWELLLDLTPSLPLAAVLVALQWYMQSSALRRLGIWLGVPAASSQRLAKFTSQVWRLLFYFAASVYGTVLLLQFDWFSLPLRQADVTSMFTVEPHTIWGPESGCRLYYIFEVAFYIGECVALVSERKRSDFAQYALHHAVTLLLMALSYAARLEKTGVYVLLLHDLSDLPLALAKSLHYAKWERATVGAMVVLFASFFFLRLVCLPFVVYYTASPWYFHRVREPSPVYWTLVVLLGAALQQLHIYWFYLLSTVVVRTVLRRESPKDIRSESDDVDEVPATDGTERQATDMPSKLK